LVGYTGRATVCHCEQAQTVSSWAGAFSQKRNGLDGCIFKLYTFRLTRAPAVKAGVVKQVTRGTPELREWVRFLGVAA
jgi:lipopolysaccharide/colanic/teichoic acid biosynthesis glycosyltransferase